MEFVFIVLFSPVERLLIPEFDSERVYVPLLSPVDVRPATTGRTDSLGREEVAEILPLLPELVITGDELATVFLPFTANPRFDGFAISLFS